MIYLVMLAAMESWKGGEISENLRMPVKAEYTTAKPIVDLELCVADALSTSGTISIVRDGDKNVIILAAQPRDRGYVSSAYLSPNVVGRRFNCVYVTMTLMTGCDPAFQYAYDRLRNLLGDEAVTGGEEKS